MFFVFFLIVEVLGGFPFLIFFEVYHVREFLCFFEFHQVLKTSKPSKNLEHSKQRFVTYDKLSKVMMACSRVVFYT